jgi:multidrug resistance efflux pump
MKRILLTSCMLSLLFACSQEESSKPTAAGQSTVNPADTPVRQIIATGKVEPEQEVTSLAATTGGLVVEVFKTDGDSVQANELLLQLDDELERLRIAELSARQQTLRTQITIEASAVREAEIKLLNKRRLLDSGQRLLDKGAETRQSVDDLQTEVSALEVNLDKLRTAVRLAESQLAELGQQLASARTELARKQLRAPFAATILDMKARPGAALNQYATYAEVAPTGPYIVRAEVDELFADRLQPGQQVDIRYTGTDKVIASGQITRLSPYLKKKSLFSENASDQEDRRVREVRIALNGQQGLIINAKVECVINL